MVVAAAFACLGASWKAVLVGKSRSIVGGMWGPKGIRYSAPQNCQLWPHCPTTLFPQDGRRQRSWRQLDLGNGVLRVCGVAWVAGPH